MESEGRGREGSAAGAGASLELGFEGGKNLGLSLYKWEKLKFRRELDGGGVSKLGVGSIFLATDRSTVYLFLATDGLTVNMNIYSDRQSISKWGFSVRWSLNYL